MTTNKIDNKLLDSLKDSLSPKLTKRLDEAVNTIIKTKKKDGKVVVVTGSGPNIHEGVTTLIAELIQKEIIDGVSTSSAVIAHELAGSLDKVKRVPGTQLGFDLQPPLSFATPQGDGYFLPRGELFEFTQLTDTQIEIINKDFQINMELYNKSKQIEGKTIIKAAGNMAYPMGPRTEMLAETLLEECVSRNEPLEIIGGLGADPKTMIGAGVKNDVPVLVSTPQLVGGGNVGICVADSTTNKERSVRIAKMLARADVIIESALALAQEIHDGPFETYTGHGIWARYHHVPTYSLRGKKLIRIDLDPALEKVWEKEREGGDVQAAINEGKPKTKLFNVPFRMEMSGFARLENSNPLVGDIGVLWPLIAREVAEGLSINLEFMSYPQDTDAGQKMREWIVENITFFNLDRYQENKQEL